MKLLNIYLTLSFLIFYIKESLSTSTKNKAMLATNMDFLHYMKNKADEDKNIANDFKFKSSSSSRQAGNNPNDAKYQFKDGKFESWSAISSVEFKNVKDFPPVKLPNGTEISIDINTLNYRINYANCTLSQFDVPRPIDDNRLFFFTLTETCNFIYTSTPTDLNLFGFYNATKFTGLSTSEDYSGEAPLYCISYSDEFNKQWTVCDPVEENYLHLRCLIARCAKQENLIDQCFNNANVRKDLPKKIIKQPIVMVPLPSPTCNFKWNYLQFGEDWVCTCKEGFQQSPVDLPEKSRAIDNPVRPVFKYDTEISSVNDESTVEGLQTKGEKLKVINSQGMIQIMHYDMGKIITMDGTIYQAQQITFHTPSNHRINGKQYDLEVTIVHTGITKGDIAKQATLSFLFEASVGAYNLFFDDLDLFSLPNPYMKYSDITNSLHISKLLYERGDEKENNVSLIRNFSFYTYQGSLPFPPCTEDTIVYVASTPLKLSTTSITLLKEALQKPDLKDKFGKIYKDRRYYTSSRNVQEINGRPIFHWENKCKETIKKPLSDGHYEKITEKATQYFYINSSEPSGIPGALVVPKKEAMAEDASQIS